MTCWYVAARGGRRRSRTLERARVERLRTLRATVFRRSTRFAGGVLSRKSISSRHPVPSRQRTGFLLPPVSVALRARPRGNGFLERGRDRENRQVVRPSVAARTSSSRTRKPLNTEIQSTPQSAQDSECCINVINIIGEAKVVCKILYIRPFLFLYTASGPLIVINYFYIIIITPVVYTSTRVHTRRTLVASVQILRVECAQLYVPFDVEPRNTVVPTVCATKKYRLSPLLPPSLQAMPRRDVSKNTRFEKGVENVYESPIQYISVLA